MFNFFEVNFKIMSISSILNRNAWVSYAQIMVFQLSLMFSDTNECEKNYKYKMPFFVRSVENVRKYF